MEPGRGRTTLGPTLRWQLRKIYCPAFACSLTKSTAIKWKTSDLKYFLTNPKEKCEYELKTKWTKEPPKGQLDLFYNANSKTGVKTGGSLMARIKEIEFVDILNKLPDIVP